MSENNHDHRTCMTHSGWFRFATYCGLAFILLQAVDARLNCPRQQHFGRHVNTDHLRFKNCVLQMRKNSSGAGKVRNVRGECLYNATSMDNFRYLISWDAPIPTRQAVTGYQLHIRYYYTHKYACFQVPRTQRSMIFNASVGFIAGCTFDVAITPQPISADVDTYHAEMTRLTGCPIAPQLMPLYNVLVSRGSTFLFRAHFDRRPFPKPKVRWYFSSDERRCINRYPIEKHDKTIKLSDDNLTLRVTNAQAKHVGCYVVTAHNGFGHLSEQRGYLRLNETLAMSARSMQDHLADVQGRILVTLIAGFLVFVVLIAMMVVICRRKKIRSRRIPVQPLLRKKIYISHSFQLKKEVALLARFASFLQSSGIDVVIDIFNQVQINNMGGWGRWISLKMEQADKIVVILTQDYLSMLQESLIDITKTRTPEMTEHIRKVHTEFNFINNILHNELHDPKSILLVTKGVSCVSLLRVFSNVQCVEFPEKFDIEKDVNFRTIVKLLG